MFERYEQFAKQLGINHPVLLAPMDLVAGGRLAAAVTNAGGSGSDGVTMAMRHGCASSSPRRRAHGWAWVSLHGAYRGNRI